MKNLHLVPPRGSISHTSSSESDIEPEWLTTPEAVEDVDRVMPLDGIATLLNAGDVTIEEYIELAESQIQIESCEITF